jgi:hypothetical protein
MAAMLFNVPRVGIAPANGLKLFFYIPGSTTKRNTYTTSALSVANNNPVVADGNGLFPAIYVDSELGYKCVLAPSTDTDPPAAPIFTQDNAYTSAGSLAQFRVVGPFTSSGQFQAKGTNAALEVMNAAGTQNWSFGVKDSDSSSLHIGGSYGPGQSVVPSLSVKPTSGLVTVGATAANSPGGLLNVCSNDTYGANDWVLWLERTGATGGGLEALARIQHFGASGGMPILAGMSARGTKASPTAVLSGDNLLVLDGRGYDGSAVNHGEYAVGWSDTRAGLHMKAGANWSGTDHSAYLSFLTTASGTIATTEKLRILPAGHLTMIESTANPSAGDLTSGTNAKDRLAVYMKADKLVFAYNNAGTVTYITLDLDGSDTSFTHGTSAP